MKIEITCTEEEYEKEDQIQEAMSGAMKELVDAGLSGKIEIIVTEKPKLERKGW